MQLNLRVAAQDLREKRPAQIRTGNHRHAD